MSWKKNRVPYQIREQREKELHELVYRHEGELTIVQYEMYHFRIFKGNRCVDIWPSRKKYYASWFTESKVYENVDEILKAFDDAPKVKITK